MKNWQIPRRTFLKGLGTAMALPLLDSMQPAVVAATATGAPRRMAFVYVPNGANMADWRPKNFGPCATCRWRGRFQRQWIAGFLRVRSEWVAVCWCSIF